MRNLLLILLLMTSYLIGSEPTTILDYWMGPLSARLCDPAARAEIWYRGGEGVDEEIYNQFGEDHHNARYGGYRAWEQTPRDRLALIILLDQFSRNIYRDSPEAFATDALALRLVLEGMEQEEDLTLCPVERLFFYMPLQHAEDRDIQRLSIMKFEQLVAQSDTHFLSMAKNSLEYAKRHREIIERFGRFPHRNNVLGRTSTPEEVAFLQEPNSSF